MHVRLDMHAASYTCIMCMMCCVVCHREVANTVLLLWITCTASWVLCSTCFTCAANLCSVSVQCVSVVCAHMCCGASTCVRCEAHGCLGSWGTVEQAQHSTPWLGYLCLTRVARRCGVCARSAAHPAAVSRCALVHFGCRDVGCFRWMRECGGCCVSQAWYLASAMTSLHSTWRSAPGYPEVLSPPPHPHTPTPTPRASCPPPCSDRLPIPSPAQRGCCHGWLQLSRDEVPCWGASQAGCCAAGACLQPHWRFPRLGEFVCSTPCPAQPHAVWAGALSGEAVGYHSLRTHQQLSVPARPTCSAAVPKAKVQARQTAPMQHLHRSRRAAGGAGTSPAVVGQNGSTWGQPICLMAAHLQKPKPKTVNGRDVSRCNHQAL